MPLVIPLPFYCTTPVSTKVVHYGKGNYAHSSTLRSRLHPSRDFQGHGMSPEPSGDGPIAALHLAHVPCTRPMYSCVVGIFPLSVMYGSTAAEATVHF